MATESLKDPSDINESAFFGELLRLHTVLSKETAMLGEFDLPYYERLTKIPLDGSLAKGYYYIVRKMNV